MTATRDRAAELNDVDPLIAFADPLVSRLMALSGDDAVRVAKMNRAMIGAIVSASVPEQPRSSGGTAP